MKYTKMDLVDYIYPRSNVTKKRLMSASVEELESVIERWGRWKDFEDALPGIVELRRLNKVVNGMFRNLKNGRR